MLIVFLARWLSNHIHLRLFKPCEIFLKKMFLAVVDQEADEIIAVKVKQNPHVGSHSVAKEFNIQP